MEAPWNEHYVKGSRYRGWFVAPATTNYRFYMACDDTCDLNINLTPDTTDDPTTLFEKVEVTGSGGNKGRYYYNPDKEQISDWVSLTEGESYFLESLFYSAWGNNFYSLGVEIEQTDMEGHHHAIKEIQTIGVEPKQQYDTIRITVENLDDGSYSLVF